MSNVSANNATNLSGGLPNISLRRQMQRKTLPRKGGYEQFGRFSITARRTVDSSLHKSSPSSNDYQPDLNFHYK
jgi:hypothetical protein